MAAVAACAIPAACLPALAATAPTKPRIELVGDSTLTYNAGYGRGFCANLTSQATCIDDAKGGASTKTYYQQGYWTKALADKPDYMLIQFGDNDEQSPRHLPRETTMPQYSANLRRFVTQARAHGIHPILVTPISRRYYGADGKIHSDLLSHAAAMRKVAEQMHVPLIPLQQDSIAYLDRLTPSMGLALGITKKDAAGHTIMDKTHMNYFGSYIFGRMVAVDMSKAVPSLARYVIPHAALLPRAGERAMDIFYGAPVTIELVGDSTVNAGSGWGPGFCADLTPNVKCVNMAKNGRSSKSYYNEGWWTKALAVHPDYMLIQFGHNDMPGKGPARETSPNTTYAANMRRYIQQARAHGIHPIIVTSISRRNYVHGKLRRGLKPYAAAAKRVAEQEHVPVIDLYSISVHILSKMNQHQADAFDLVHHKAGKVTLDHTHLNAFGATYFGRIVANDLARRCPTLGPDVKGYPKGTLHAMLAQAMAR